MKTNLVPCVLFSFCLSIATSSISYHSLAYLAAKKPKVVLDLHIETYNRQFIVINCEKYMYLLTYTKIEREVIKQKSKS